MHQLGSIHRIMTTALAASLLLPSGAYAANTTKPFTDSTTAQKYAYEEVMDLSPSFHFTACLPGHDQYQYIDRYTSLCRSLYQLDNGKSGYRGDFAAYNLYRQDTVSYLQIKRGLSWYCYVEDSICYTVTQSQQQKYRKRKKALLKSLHLSKDKTEKAQYKNVRKIYRWITGHVKYDYTKSKTSAYDALILKKATCNGYAALFYDLCRDSGISCRIIIGHTDTLRDSLHAWNIVRIGKKWFDCDPTWDAGSIFQPYFLSGSKHFSEEHFPWKRYRTKSFKKNFPISSHDYDPDAL